jgi:hypothetical protein
MGATDTRAAGMRTNGTQAADMRAAGMRTISAQAADTRAYDDPEKG